VEGSQTSAPAFIVTLPEIVWELALGIWLIVKGLPSPILSGVRAPSCRRPDRWSDCLRHEDRPKEGVVGGKQSLER
jgi:hypothetical protein